MSEWKGRSKMINEQELLSKLIQSIADLSTPRVRLDQTLWNAAKCAEYLDMSKSAFQTRYAPHPKFPKRIKLPSTTGKSDPRWIAGEVIDWAIKSKE